MSFITDKDTLNNIESEYIQSCNPLLAGAVYTDFRHEPNQDMFSLLRWQWKDGTYTAFKVGNYILQCGNELTENYRDNFIGEVNDAATPKHIEDAQAVLDYYRSKFAIMKLQGIPFNSWQSSLYDYITRSSRSLIKSEEIGMLSCVYTMYLKDIERDRVLSQADDYDINKIDTLLQHRHILNVSVLGGYLAHKGRIMLMGLVNDEIPVNLTLPCSGANLIVINAIERNNYIIVSGYPKVKNYLEADWISYFNPTIELV